MCRTREHILALYKTDLLITSEPAQLESELLTAPALPIDLPESDVDDYSPDDNTNILEDNYGATLAESGEQNAESAEMEIDASEDENEDWMAEAQRVENPSAFSADDWMPPNLDYDQSLQFSALPQPHQAGPLLWKSNLCDVNSSSVASIHDAYPSTHLFDHPSTLQPSAGLAPAPITFDTRIPPYLPHYPLSSGTVINGEVAPYIPVFPTINASDSMMRTPSKTAKIEMSIQNLINERVPTPPTFNQNKVSCILKSPRWQAKPVVGSISPSKLCSKRGFDEVDQPCEPPMMLEQVCRVFAPCRKITKPQSDVATNADTPMVTGGVNSLTDTNYSVLVKELEAYKNATADDAEVSNAPDPVPEERPAQRRRTGLGASNWVSALVGVAVGTLTTGWVLGSVDASQHFFA